MYYVVKFNFLIKPFNSYLAQNVIDVFTKKELEKLENLENNYVFTAYVFKCAEVETKKEAKAIQKKLISELEDKKDIKTQENWIAYKEMIGGL